MPTSPSASSPLLLQPTPNTIRAPRPDPGAALGEGPFIDGSRFTAGDLMMATVLRILRHTELAAGQPSLAGWLERCEDRPAFQRALAGQMTAFA